MGRAFLPSQTKSTARLQFHNRRLKINLNDYEKSDRETITTMSISQHTYKGFFFLEGLESIYFVGF